MAATGFFYTFTRPRTSLPMSMLKYDPIGTIPPRPILDRIAWTDTVDIVRRKVLFLEQKRKGK
jgi:large subunit ribosomal protein L33